MSYTRDKDAHTRGVGAIAAADGSRARRARQGKIARALRARDRAMSGMTMGPRGGLVGMGLISNVGTSRQNLATPVRGQSIGYGIESGAPGTAGGRPSTVIVTPPVRGGYSSSPTSSLPVAPMSYNTSAVPLLPAQYAPGVATPIPPPTNVGPGRGFVGPTPKPPLTYTCADGSVVAMQSLCPTPASSSTSTDTSSTTAPVDTSSGGGGGGGAGIATAPGTPATFTPPTTPDEIPAGTGMSTGMMVAIGAAALGGLYLLFGKKRGGP